MTEHSMMWRIVWSALFAFGLGFALGGSSDEADPTPVTVAQEQTSPVGGAPVTGGDSADVPEPVGMDVTEEDCEEFMWGGEDDSG